MAQSESGIIALGDETIVRSDKVERNDRVVPGDRSQLDV